MFKTHQQEPLPAVFSDSSLRQEGIVRIFQGNENNIYLSTNRHTYRYRVQEQTLNRKDVVEPSVVYNDSRGNVWIGSIDEGYQVIYNDLDRFRKHNQLCEAVGRQPVRSVATDRHHWLWIATKKDGLLRYSIQDKDVKKIDVGLSSDIPYYLFVDHRHRLWTSSTSGLRCYTFDGHSLHLEKAIRCGLILDMTQDDNGTVWASGSTPTAIAVSEDLSYVKEYEFGQSANSFVPNILNIGKGVILASIYTDEIVTIDTKTDELKRYEIPQKNYEEALSHMQYIPTDSYLDSKTQIWFGTVGHGTLVWSQKDRTLNAISGISCTDVSAIQEDIQGNIWISTMYGLNKYDPISQKVTSFYYEDGIGGNQFYDRAACTLPDGTLVFGGTHGLTVFDPLDITIQRNIPLLFENLRVHNQLVLPGEGNSIDKSLPHKPDIHISHDQNSFSISFSAIDYGEFENVHYSYQLEGFDREWVDARSDHEANYANVPAGSYTFKVRIVDENQEKPLAENAIRVEILPAPWNTWWAWLLYLLAAAAVISYILRMHLRNRAEKASAERIRLEKESEKRESTMRMRFFANVSHEFRTPLTLISGPVEQLAKSHTLQGDEKHLLNMVQHSVRRMLKLINQLLSFAQLENDALKLYVTRSDAISCLRQTIEMFSFQARQKGITLRTNGLEDSFLMWLDADKLDKIMVNLLSNAMKYTERGGEIVVDFDVIDRQAVIKVTDSGLGIPPEEQEKIFQRFYQLNNQDASTQGMGTGIGLYYSRCLAELHHGTLTASNRQDRQGAVFTLQLPTDDECYPTNERITMDEQLTESEGQVSEWTEDRYYAANHPDANPTDNVKDGDKPSLLVVDDDPEVVNYLQILLSADYHVTYRFDADSALQVMSAKAPNIIICDVIMPGRGGYDFCRQVKNDTQFSHIPFILLTAKANADSQVEGFDSGADAYLTKPFNPQVLLAIIKSQLANSIRAKALLNLSTKTDEDMKQVLSPQDNNFMNELYKIMEDELMNTDLDITRLAERLNISRTKLYYKMKGLTGTKPSTFFRTYKLNRAAELIKSGEYNISEITYMTGFSSLSYFSTCFKKQFGVAPSEYKG